MLFFVFILFTESKFKFKQAMKDLGQKIGAEFKEKTKGVDIGKYLDSGIDYLANEAKKKYSRLGPFIEKLSIFLKKFLRHKFSSIYSDPVEIDQIDKEVLSDIFTTEDLQSIIEPISYEFGIDGDQIATYFDQVKTETESKRAFHTFNISIKDDPKYRLASVGTTLLKVVKNGNEYSAHVKKVQGTANILANTDTKEGQQTDKNWRPFDTDEVDDVFNTIKEQIKPDIEQMKKEQ